VSTPLLIRGPRVSFDRVVYYFDRGASAREAMTTLKTATPPVRCPAETTADLKITISVSGAPTLCSGNAQAVARRGRSSWSSLARLGRCQ
jgi:hypothetical protein